MLIFFVFLFCERALALGLVDAACPASDVRAMATSWAKREAPKGAHKRLLRDTKMQLFSGVVAVLRAPLGAVTAPSRL